MITTARVAATLLASIALLSSTAIAQATPGCGKEHTSGMNRYNITSSNTNRTFYVNIPSDYDSNKGYKTIFGFHGAGTYGALVEADTRLGTSRWGTDKIMVYPDGIDGLWATLGNATTPLAEDMQFVHDVLEYMRDNYCIDNDKVYATGISNGGGIINHIACNETLGLNFAAFAPVAGAYSGFDLPCNPSRVPVPIISFHGGNDTVVPYEGRGGVSPLPPIPEWLNRWVDLNNCTNPRNQTKDYNNGTYVTHLIWECGGIQGAMEHFFESDMGHVWPSRTPNFSQAADGSGPTDVEANSEMLRFFGELPLNKTVTENPDDNTPSPTESTGPGATETDEPNAAGRVVIGGTGDAWAVGLVLAVAGLVGGMLV